MATPQIRLKNPATAGLLAWLVPGLGHVYQGRIGKGVLYATCILGLYGVGLALGEGKVVFWSWINPLQHPEEFRLSSIGQLGVGLPAILALIQGTLIHYEVNPLLGGILAEPTLHELNGLQASLSKLWEVGMLYTVMAGLLNVLAIYDAYAGPATSEDDPALTPAEATGRDSQALRTEVTA